MKQLQQDHALAAFWAKSDPFAPICTRPTITRKPTCRKQAIGFPCNCWPRANWCKGIALCPKCSKRMVLLELLHQPYRESGHQLFRILPSSNLHWNPCQRSPCMLWHQPPEASIVQHEWCFGWHLLQCTEHPPWLAFLGTKAGACLLPK